MSSLICCIICCIIAAMLGFIGYSSVCRYRLRLRRGWGLNTQLGSSSVTAWKHISQLFHCRALGDGHTSCLKVSGRIQIVRICAKVADAW
ncbi:hypothetical protein EJ02DRAFT_459064 [Clathrospora elynae]|uniref:Uncharacterized protein n=1 Tax=Clathrospora elynae TaxID=706981 RepID=A0A6A5SBX9_9PLEO|nr:hypothetical protein EJ02DRAFT_459064 [Clathrospora elynae]